jgi:hypothetical protein
MAQTIKRKETEMSNLKNKKTSRKSRPGETLKNLLDQIYEETPSVLDTIPKDQIARLRPLAWLIQNQKYTMLEIMKTAMAYHEEKPAAARAEDILNLIRSRQAQHKTDKGAK